MVFNLYSCVDSMTSILLKSPLSEISFSSPSMTITVTVLLSGVKNEKILKSLFSSGKNPLSRQTEPIGMYFEKCANP